MHFAHANRRTSPAPWPCFAPARPPYCLPSCLPAAYTQRTLKSQRQIRRAPRPLPPRDPYCTGRVHTAASAHVPCLCLSVSPLRLVSVSPVAYARTRSPTPLRGRAITGCTRGEPWPPMLSNARSRVGHAPRAAPRARACRRRMARRACAGSGGRAAAPATHEAACPAHGRHCRALSSARGGGWERRRGASASPARGWE